VPVLWKSVWRLIKKQKKLKITPPNDPVTNQHTRATPVHHIYHSTTHNNQAVEWAYLQPMNGWTHVIYVYNGGLLTYNEEWNYVIYKKMDGIVDCHFDRDKIRKPSTTFLLLCSRIYSYHEDDDDNNGRQV
jgi:hypothetical protein